jgi:hypothetical protein
MGGGAKNSGDPSLLDDRDLEGVDQSCVDCRLPVEEKDDESCMGCCAVVVVVVVVLLLLVVVVSGGKPEGNEKFVDEFIDEYGDAAGTRAPKGRALKFSPV